MVPEKGRGERGKGRRVRAGSRWTSPGFEVVEHPGARVLARPEAVAWVRFVLENGQGLHAASARDKAAQRLEGRDPVFVIPAKLSINVSPDR